ncbi:hypothetical protein ACFVT2_30845 [Streptomyces sp. NPDC058000]|uniref:hypothetical protein n=1 Tax=Streptomyces sp. NPDC058000 TaxID=3346299 RepID=UPI0036EA8545
MHPIIVGSGKHLFPEGDRIPLRLASSSTLSTGVHSLVYTPDDERDEERGDERGDGRDNEQGGERGDAQGDKRDAG